VDNSHATFVINGNPGLPLLSSVPAVTFPAPDHYSPLCMVYVTAVVRCPSVQLSVRLSVPSIDICRLPQPGRGQQISVDTAGARAAAAGSVMSRVEGRGSTLTCFILVGEQRHACVSAA